MIISHLPDGPTAHFKLSSVKLSKDIKVCQWCLVIINDYVQCFYANLQLHVQNVFLDLIYHAKSIIKNWNIGLCNLRVIALAILLCELLNHVLQTWEGYVELFAGCFKCCLCNKNYVVGSQINTYMYINALANIQAQDPRW